MRPHGSGEPSRHTVTIACGGQRKGQAWGKRQYYINQMIPDVKYSSRMKTV